MYFCKKTGTWIGNEDDVNWDLMSEADAASEDHDSAPLSGHGLLAASLHAQQQVPHSSIAASLSLPPIAQIAVLHEFDVTDALAHEWAESEAAHHELAPWFASGVIDATEAASDAHLRSTLIRRVVADCERAGAALRRTRSASAAMLTPRNRSPSFGSRTMLSAPPAVSTQAAGASGAVATTAASASADPFLIDDSESDIDDAFDVGDIGLRLRGLPQRSPRRATSGRPGAAGGTTGIPMLTFQALQALGSTGSPTKPTTALHKRSSSSNGDESAASSSVMVARHRPAAPPVSQARQQSSSELIVRRRTPAPAPTATAAPVTATSAVAAAFVPPAAARTVDPSDLSVYANVGSLFSATPHVGAAAPHFVSLSTGYATSGEFWVPDTPYRPRSGEATPTAAAAAASNASTAATVAAAVSARHRVLPTTRVSSPPFLISRTGAWLKSQ